MFNFQFMTGERYMTTALTNKQTIAWIMVTLLSSPLSAYTDVEANKTPNCTESGKPIIPSQFYLDLGDDLALEERLGLKPWAEELDEAEWETLRLGGDKEIHKAGPELERRPDFQERYGKWRLIHGLPATVDCSSERLSAEPRSLIPRAGGITTVPQHSLANNIFRKQRIAIQLFDAKIRDGDIVKVYFNNVLIGQVTLPSELLSSTIGLTLQPSDLLPGKVNVLKFVGVSSGSLPIPPSLLG
jgi:hypothetical protein